THSHELDEDLSAAIQDRRDFAWLGLIGSVSKRRRFVHRLARRGIPEDQLERLVCPVGAAGIRGKRPATIALSIAAQLLQDVVPAGWR
ncbi:MAG: xanthine dehydrogenase accessory protein XdhC, partial [Xanthomonadales bacterium]|nr:xanthine dehydrogenase accessory protein XdhC [Xanthomonadales bacterium]